MSKPKLGERGTPAIPFEASGNFDSKPTKSKPNVLPSDMERLADTSIIETSEEKRAELQLARRQEKVGHPGALQGAEAEAFVERKLVELSVDAVMEYEYLMKYGSNEQRERIAGKVLDATGHGKKERSGANTQLIIVNGMVAGAPLPWAKPAAEAKVVDAKPLPPTTP